MSIKLEIVADDPQAFFNQLAGAIGTLRAVGPAAAAANAAAPAAATVPVKQPEVPHTVEGAPAEKPAETKATRTRKPKDEPKVEAPAETKTEAPKDEAAPVPPIDEVRAALKKLASNKGDDEVFKLLGEFKAKNASAVPEEKRAEVIAKVDELCAAE